MTPLFQGLQNLFGVLLSLNDNSLNDNRINSDKEPKKLNQATRRPVATEPVRKTVDDNLLRNNLFGRTE
jgi:hypothetical protein